MKRCLVCAALEGSDVCASCGGPFDTTDRHERRAIRNLAKVGLLRGAAFTASWCSGTLANQDGKGPR